MPHRARRRAAELRERAPWRGLARARARAASLARRGARARGGLRNRAGVGYAIPAFEEAGVATARDLAKLELGPDFDAVGVTDEDDRRKLFYLVEV